VTDSNWAALAAIGQMLAAFAGLAALVFVGVQLRDSRKSADFQNLLKFDQLASERESGLLHAETEATKRQAFFEFTNFLETHAAALNAGLLPRVSRKLVREKLIDSIVLISEEPSWHQTLFDGITSPTTYVELATFMRREKRAIGLVTRGRAAVRASQGLVETRT
jgi:hypothetical protein